jgi:hypothetical protein
MGSSQTAPVHPTQQLSTLLPNFSSTQRPEPSTGSHIIEVPMGDKYESSVTPLAPTVVMASPLPASTPTVPSIQMGSPSPYSSTGALIPMQVDALQERTHLTGQCIARLYASNIPEQQPAISGRGSGNMAR